MLLFYHEPEVKGLSLTDNRIDNADEGLRVLARLIARRLIVRKTDVYGQRYHPGLPTSGVDEKTGF